MTTLEEMMATKLKRDQIRERLIMALDPEFLPPLIADLLEQDRAAHQTFKAAFTDYQVTVAVHEGKDVSL